MWLYLSRDWTQHLSLRSLTSRLNLVLSGWFGGAARSRLNPGGSITPSSGAGHPGRLELLLLLYLLERCCDYEPVKGMVVLNRPARRRQGKGLGWMEQEIQSFKGGREKCPSAVTLCCVFEGGLKVWLPFEGRSAGKWGINEPLLHLLPWPRHPAAPLEPRWCHDALSVSVSWGIDLNAPALVITYAVVTFLGEASLPLCIPLSRGNRSLPGQGEPLDSMRFVL